MSRLHVYLFGGVMVHDDEVPLPPIPGTLARSLFAYLLTHRDLSHTRDLLAGTFWPEVPDSAARRRLRQALWQVRSALQPHPLLLVEGDTIRVDPGVPLWIDTQEFETLQARCLRAPVGEERQALALGESCVQLYRGDFLAGYYHDWLFPEREQLREKLRDVLDRLVVGYKRQGDYAAALGHARRMASEDVLDEEAHREVMRLCHMLGRHTEALQQFETCRQALRAQLDVDPSPSTAALAREIAHRGAALLQIDPPRPPSPSSAIVSSSHASQLPLIGRRAERGQILTHVEALMHGVGGVVLLEGEAGVGKTRLIQTLAADARWRGAEVLWGDAQAGDTSTPYGVLVEALSGGLSPLRAAQLAHTTGELWLQVLAPLLPPLAGARPGLRPPPALAPQQERDRLVDALSQLLATWAHIVPLLLVLEDLQWAGPDTLDLLAGLAPTLDERGVLVLGSYRTEAARASADTWQKLQAIDRAGARQRLALPRLDAAASSELVRRCLGAGRPAPGFAARLFDETAGNPLFLLETLRTLHGEGLLVRDEEGQWSTAAEAGADQGGRLPLPPLVEQTIARRTHTLGPLACDTLRLAAVLGKRFRFDLLRAAASAAPSELLGTLRVLIEHRFLDEGAEGYRFHHDKIRQVVYGGIEPHERRRLHRQTAQALESIDPDQTAALAHHWTAAHAWSRASEFHTLAGDQARTVYANAEAERHYTSALDALARLPDPPDPGREYELRRAREEMRARLGSREGQRDDLEALEVLARQIDGDGLRLAVAMRWAEYEMDTGDPAAARSRLEPLVDLAHASGDRHTEARCLNLLGQAHHLLGEAQQSRAYNERALALQRAGGDVSGQACTLISCCVACIFSEDHAAAEAYALEAQQLCLLLGDRQGDGHASHLLSRVYRDQGRLALALEHATHAMAIAHELGRHLSEAYHLLELGNLTVEMGDYAPAHQTIESALALFRKVDDRRGAGYALMDLGLLDHYMGNGPLARARVAEGKSLVVASGDRWGEAGGHSYLGIIHERQGEPLAAADSFRQALAIKRELEQHAWALVDVAGLARLALDAGRHAEAMEHAREILDWIEGRPPTGVEQPASIYLTVYRVLSTAGDAARARQVLADGYRFVTGRAEQLDDEALRERFIGGIAANRDLVAAYRARMERTVVVQLPGCDAPTGRPLREDEYVPVTWTVAAPEDEAIEEGPARRHARLARLLREAAGQGGAPRIADLAAALAVSAPTVRRDLAALRQAGHAAATRGHQGG